MTSNGVTACHHAWMGRVRSVITDNKSLENVIHYTDFGAKFHILAVASSLPTEVQTPNKKARQNKKAIVIDEGGRKRRKSTKVIEDANLPKAFLQPEEK